MFYHIEGTVTDIEPYTAVLDCGGVGFRLNTSMNTLSRIKLGDRVKLYTSESVREDAFELYGFATKNERRSYELLTGVSGVGPKAAVSILSSASPEALAMAVVSGDEKLLTAAPGIGKKIAQRVILELKDKIAKECGDFRIPTEAAPASSGGSDKLSDAAAALGVLGYGAGEINAALRGVDVSGQHTEDIIKQALKNMMK